MKKKFILISIIIFIFLLYASCIQPFFAEEGAILEIKAVKTNLNFNESVTIYIVGYNSDGSLLWDGTRVDLSIENGTLSATNVELKDGKAEVIATGDQERGVMKIYARSGTVSATPNPLTITVGTYPLVADILIFANSQFLPEGGGVSKITAYLYDEYYQPIIDRAVLFSTGNGSLQSQGKPLYTDSEGKAMDYLTTTQGTWVYAKSGWEEAKVYVFVNGE